MTDVTPNANTAASGKSYALTSKTPLVEIKLR